jgi:Cys-tRNA(Pro)/Cys-tRNA(Cys) deacylase
MAAKTPALVALTRAGIPHTVHDFGHDSTDRNYGKAAAAALGVEEQQVFKTLVVVADGHHAVGIVPVAGQLSLKGIAAALQAKKAEMCDPAVAQRITGYVVGGISPFGQRKLLPTVLDDSAAAYETIFVSGGRRGLDVEVAPDDLLAVLDATLAPIAAA